jgi:acyl-CoA thioester hydrolase
MQDVTYKGVVYPWHCDHMGHMNVMWYTGKFDEATWNLLAQVGVSRSYLEKSNAGMAGVQQNTSYKRELMAGDVIEILSRVVEVRDKVVRLEHRMKNVETGEIAATTELTAVHIDRRTRKSCPFPASVRAALDARLEPSSRAVSHGSQK